MRPHDLKNGRRYGKFNTCLTNTAPPCGIFDVHWTAGTRRHIWELFLSDGCIPFRELFLASRR